MKSITDLSMVAFTLRDEARLSSIESFKTHRDAFLVIAATFFCLFLGVLSRQAPKDKDGNRIPNGPLGLPIVGA